MASLPTTYYYLWLRRQALLPTDAPHLSCSPCLQVLLGYEYDSKLPAKQPKGGYRPQHNNRKTHSPTARDLPVERHWTRCVSQDPSECLSFHV